MVKHLEKDLKIRIWLLVVGVSFLVIGAAYTMAQQSSRLSANDLALSNAQIARKQLNINTPPASVVSLPIANLATDSIPFLIITDNYSHIIASSARLNGEVPLPPAGVFSYTKQNGSDHITWQPSNGVRLATEVLTYGNNSDGGFIIAGQSLKQADHRIVEFGYIAIAAWLGVIVWTTALLYWSPPKIRKTNK